MTPRGILGLCVHFASACTVAEASAWISLAQVSARMHQRIHTSQLAPAMSRGNVESSPRYNVALAFHGAYMRNKDLGDTFNVALAYRTGQACSNFFLAEENIRNNIIQPLEDEGANVSIYVDSYQRTDCTWRDRELRERLQPTRINMNNDADMWDSGECYLKGSNTFGCRVVDSYMRVLNLILKDKSMIDYIVMLRFDVTYSLPITSWNMTWDATYAAFMQSGHGAFAHNRFVAKEGEETEDNPDSRNWKACRMVSDLLFTLPISHAEPLIRALDWSGMNDTNIEHVGVEGPYEGEQVMCYHDAGDGHFVWQPFVREMGEGSMRIMDTRIGLRSDDTGADCKSFLCIDRSCGDDYSFQCER